MEHMENDEKIFYDCLGLSEIKEDHTILSKIKLDVTPQTVMEPRYQSNPEDLKKLAAIAGYIFYVESECEPPALMLMKIGKTDITQTIGKIDEVPVEYIRRAIENPVHPPSHGMYAITDEIKDWLKKELGL